MEEAELIWTMLYYYPERAVEEKDCREDLCICALTHTRGELGGTPADGATLQPHRRGRSWCAFQGGLIVELLARTEPKFRRKYSVSLQASFPDYKAWTPSSTLSDILGDLFLASCSIHQCLQGTRAILKAQWRSLRPCHLWVVSNWLKYARYELAMVNSRIARIRLSF